METSPIQLTEEQKRAVFEDKKKQFLEGYNELCARVGLIFRPAIDISPLGIRPVNTLDFYEPKKELLHEIDKKENNETR